MIVESSAATVQLRTPAERAGLSVPEDFSLVGLSGTPEVPGVEQLSEFSIPRGDRAGHHHLDCSVRDAGTIGPPPSGD